MTDDRSRDDDPTAEDDPTADDDPTARGNAGDASDTDSESERETETWEPRPVPDVTPETERFWRAASDDRFLLCECPDCGLLYHYPRALCPDCFGESTWREATSEGEVYSYSIARQVSGWPESALPLVVAYVALDEGPRVLTNVIDCAPEEIGVGTRVAVRFVPTTEENVSIPVFAPVDT